MTRIRNKYTNQTYKKAVFHLHLMGVFFAISFVIVALSIGYILSDIKNSSKDVIVIVDGKNKPDFEKEQIQEILKPRAEIEHFGKDYTYVISEKGIIEQKGDKETIFLENVNVNSTFGHVKSDNLVVKNNRTILEFRGNPVLTINPINEAKNEKNTKN